MDLYDWGGHVNAAMPPHAVLRALVCSSARRPFDSTGAPLPVQALWFTEAGWQPDESRLWKSLSKIAILNGDTMLTHKKNFAIWQRY